MNCVVYHIRPNYCTVCLGFSKALGKLVVKKHLIRAHFKERSTEDFMRSVFNNAYRSRCCVYSFELPRLVEAIQMGTDMFFISR